MDARPRAAQRPATEPLKAISLFSGAMGFEQGLTRSGKIEVVAAAELDTACLATIRSNLDAGNLPAGMRVYAGDIADLSAATVMDDLGLAPGELDLLVGGPPCQAFSTAGRRQSVQDPRGTLLWEYLRFIQELQPRFFVMENVRGLLSAALRHRPLAERPDKGGPPLEPDEQPGAVVAAFLRDLAASGGARYRVDIFEVNAVNYGAPQLRERAIFVGSRDGQEVALPAPTHGPPVASAAPGSTRQSSLGIAPESEPRHPWKTLGDAIGQLREATPELMDFSPRKKEFLAMVPEGANWRALPESVQRDSMGHAFHAKGGRSGWWRRLSMDLPCPTLVTMPNHASTSLCHPTETRALSVREYAAIQEFHPGWIVAGKTTEKYKQIGNAVPTRLGQVVADAIVHAARAPVPEHPPVELVGRARVIYLQSHVRTKKWFSNGKAVENGTSAPESRTARKVRYITVDGGD